MFANRLAIALAALLLSAPAAQAVVDMKNANYADSWIDIVLAGTGFDLKVERFYNSRSVFIGMFGFGWCTTFETSIERLPEGTLKLQECGAGQEITYLPTKFDASSLDKTIDTIVAYYKKGHAGAAADVIADMKTRLRSSPSYRLSWAKQAGLPAPEIKKGAVFAADNLGVEQIIFDGTYYVRNLTDGTSQKFDSNGHLVYVYDKNSNYIKITHSAEGIREIIDNAGRKLSFVLTPNKRVKEITGPGGVKAEYKYKGEDLTEVKNQWKNLYAFQYDETHNLTKVTFPDKTFKAITYNAKNDWVTSFAERVIGNAPACLESYNYEFDKEDGKNHFWSTAVKKCGKETVNQARFEFWHKVRQDGRRYLERVFTKTNAESLDVTYHSEFGRPVTIRRNGVTTTYTYYPSGLIKEKATATAKLAFEYKNTFNKVSRVVTEFFEVDGKPLKDTNGKQRTRETNFTYDTKANLVAASNTDGQSVKLTYDVRGRIATIIDQAKKEVTIEYEERTGKPKVISRPKVGTISITYKPNGDINKVDSKDGPIVAVQVASTFNNLLDIIAPATSELSL